MTIDRTTDSLLQIKKVRRRTGLSTATIYRREAAGTFPSRIRVSTRCARWYESDIGLFVANPGTYQNSTDRRFLSGHFVE
jgi:prophage regulatory protein